MKLAHVAVFTADTAKSVRFYELLGGRKAAEADLDIGEGRSKHLTHMEFDGGGIVELVEPSDPGMINDCAGICDHFCFGVDDVDGTVEALRAEGIDTFTAESPVSRDILGGIRIIFLTGPSGELIELYQKEM